MCQLLNVQCVPDRDRMLDVVGELLVHVLEASHFACQEQ